jgi:hypothetical protein
LIVTGGDVNRPESTILNEGLISADISGETITIDTTRFLNSGTIEAINGGEIDYSPPLALARSGAGSFSNHGVIEISAESAMKIDGQFFQSATGTLRIAIDDLDGMPLTGLLRGDSAEFDGLLEVIAPTPFEPANGQAFRVLSFGAVSGAFASVTLPGLPDGWWWVTESLYNDGYIRAVPACGPISLALVCIGAASARRKR